MEFWEDKEIKFDLSLLEIKTRPGEEVIDRLDFIEDTKGNGGDKGRLLVTTLRVIWHSLSIARISLSVGYHCIQNISTKVVNSRLKGITEALHILAKYNSARYEFIFTNLVPGNSRHFTSVMGVYKSYTSSRLYRELKLRGALIRNKQLRILEREKIYFEVKGVWNLSSDQIRIRESKFGSALVIESSLNSGGYVLGFRIDPRERLNNTTQQLQSLHKVHTEHPEFGVHYVLSSIPLLPEETPVPTEEIIEFDESLNDISNVLISYGLDNNKNNKEEIIYSPELGLAVEQMKDGFTLQDLWEVLPNVSTQ